MKCSYTYTIKNHARTTSCGKIAEFRVRGDQLIEPRHLCREHAEKVTFGMILNGIDPKVRPL